MTRLLMTLLLAGITLASDIPLQAPIIVRHQLVVRWDKNTELDLAGYNVFFGVDSVFSHTVDVAADTMRLLDFSPLAFDVSPALARVAVSAYDESGNESELSTVVTMPVVGDSADYLFGDLDGSNRVDVIDFAYFCDAFGATKGMQNYSASADLNLDGRVDVYDHLAFVINHGAIK